MTSEDYLEREVQNQFPWCDVHVCYIEDDEAYELFVDRNRYYFQCGSDDDKYVFDATHDNDQYPREILVELPPEDLVLDHRPVELGHEEEAYFREQEEEDAHGKA